MWDLEAGAPLGVLRGHDNWVNAVAVGELRGRPIAVSGGNDETVRVWDLENGGPLGHALTGHDDWVNAVAVSGSSAGARSRFPLVNDQMVQEGYPDLEAGALLGGHDDFGERGGGRGDR